MPECFFEHWWKILDSCRLHPVWIIAFSINYWKTLDLKIYLARPLRPHAPPPPIRCRISQHFLRNRWISEPDIPVSLLHKSWIPLPVWTISSRPKHAKTLTEHHLWSWTQNGNSVNLWETASLELFLDFKFYILDQEAKFQISSDFCEVDSNSLTQFRADSNSCPVYESALM